MKIEWTPKKKDLLAEAIENWLTDHHAYSGEMMNQDDDCNTDALTLLADIVDDIIQPDTSDEDED